MISFFLLIKLVCIYNKWNSFNLSQEMKWNLIRIKKKSKKIFLIYLFIFKKNCFVHINYNIYFTKKIIENEILFKYLQSIFMESILKFNSKFIIKYQVFFINDLNFRRYNYKQNIKTIKNDRRKRKNSFYSSISSNHRSLSSLSNE